MKEGTWSMVFERMPSSLMPTIVMLTSPSMLKLAVAMILRSNFVGRVHMGMSAGVSLVVLWLAPGIWTESVERVVLGTRHTEPSVLSMLSILPSLCGRARLGSAVVP